MNSAFSHLFTALCPLLCTFRTLNSRQLLLSRMHSEDSQKNLLSLTRISVVIVKIAKVVLVIRELGHLLSICALDLGVGANVIIHTFTRR